MNDRLLRRLDLLARTPVLLVASDFDGTLAPIVLDPAAAAPEPAALSALVSLGSLSHTHAAVISGRDLATLRRLCVGGGSLHMAGSHGAELEAELAEHPQVEPAFARLAHLHAPSHGLRVERKRVGVAVHSRGAAQGDAAMAHGAARALAADLGAARVAEGHEVTEISFVPANKGDALSRIKYLTGSTGVLFVGDDSTDEDVFRILAPSDVGVHVGQMPTAAAESVPDRELVRPVLEHLLAARNAWLASRTLTPLERHSVLSDQRTACVVDPRGTIVWLCVPRLDSAALFAAMLGGPPAGFFAIEPEELPEKVSQEYVGDSLVVRTSWPSLTVTDYLDASAGRAYQRAGRTDLVRVLEGRGRARVRFAPRMDFGRVPTRIIAREGGLEIEGPPDPVVLRAPGVAWTIVPDGPHHTAEATVSLDDGPVVLELRAGTASFSPAMASEEERRRDNTRFWSGWAGSLRLPPLAQPAVKRSALLLKALCHGPSGAIAAAATTSLPEHLGGTRNWDYRFCWPRDACIAAGALVRIGNTGHALKMLDWLLEVVDRIDSPERLRPIYTVNGDHLSQEAEVPGLPGYGDSSPVRLGNAAANQVQLDVFGPIVQLVSMLAARGAPISPEHWRLVRAMTRAVAARWQEPDHGIWELRTERRHHVHSKTMCWLAVDRALRVRQYVMGSGDPEWEALRDAIRDDALAHGWSPQLNAFSTAYGRPALDASVLLIGLTGMLDPRDPRFISTVDAVQAGLRDGVAVYRYLDDDGLPGREGGMLICTGWLVESLHLIGRSDEARALFEELVAIAGPTGVLPEQFCPRHKVTLGNLPQAYSHAAVINAACALSGAPTIQD
jgi:trehalose 6-phosphate phosphatase